MKNTCPFHIVFQVLKVLFIKICKIKRPPDLLFIVVFTNFTSADIVSQIFSWLELLQSTLSEKKRFLTQIFLS